MKTSNASDQEPNAMTSDKLDSETWAKLMVHRKGYVLHLGGMVAGKAVQFFDGVREKYISPFNGEPVVGPVLKLDSGHAFLANREHFEELNERDVKFFEVAQGALVETLKQIGAVGHAMKVPEGIGVRLVVGLLRTQATTLSPANASEAA